MTAKRTPEGCAFWGSFYTNITYPTGALDQSSGKEVLKLFHRLNEMGNTIVMITHDLKVAQNAGRIVKIVDGEIFENAPL